MSSRALRKLQREKEQQDQLDASKEDNATNDESEEDAPMPKVLNAFDMLTQDQDEDEDEANDSDVAEPDHTEGISAKHNQAGPSENAKPKNKSKKKKNKKKGKAPNQNDTPTKGVQAATKGSQLDEIDLALKSLSTTSKDGADVSLAAKIDEANLQLYRLLAVESKHLNALNEMKRLFGNVVLENEDEAAAAAAAGPPRRRGRVQNLDLGGALAGRHSPASRGQGLAGLALRRNPFILGKEEWPKATNGGLGMELVEKLEDGTIEFRFVHNTIYQDVQRQFQTCVESMDPQRMIALLQYNRKTFFYSYEFGACNPTNNENSVPHLHLTPSIRNCQATRRPLRLWRPTRTGIVQLRTVSTLIVHNSSRRR